MPNGSKYHSIASAMVTKEYNRHPAGSSKGGQFAPLNKKKLVKLAQKLDKATIKNMAVNTAGLAGSIIGGSTAGPFGAIAGNLIGSLIGRQAVNLGVFAMTARDKLRQKQRFVKANKMEQTKLLVQDTLNQMAENEEQLGDKLTGDMTGWLVSNAAEIGLKLVPGLGRMPMKGAVVAMIAVPRLVKLRRKLKENK